MTNDDLGWITNYIWGIEDDGLRDASVRGKYRDVILPMTVRRRLDVVLEATKHALVNMSDALDEMGIADQKVTLARLASGRRVPGWSDADAVARFGAIHPAFGTGRGLAQ